MVREVEGRHAQTLVALSNPPCCNNFVFPLATSAAKCELLTSTPSSRNSSTTTQFLLILSSRTSSQIWCRRCAHRTLVTVYQGVFGCLQLVLTLHSAICMRKWKDIYKSVMHFMANMDGWENEKKQQLKIVTETGKIEFPMFPFNALYTISLLTNRNFVTQTIIT